MRQEINRLESILIIKLSAIGDVVHTLPLLEILRKNFPESRIDWLIEEEAGRIIDYHSCVDHVIVSRRKSWQKRIFRISEIPDVAREIGRFLNRLRSAKYELVIDLQGLFKSGLLTGLSKGERKIASTGGKEASRLFLTEKPYPVNYSEHAIERYLKVIGYLGCRMDSWEGAIPVRESDKKPIDLFFRKNNIQDQRAIAINPMARWKTKLWEPDKFSLLADRLQKELSCRIIFTGSKDDRPHVSNILDQTKNGPFNLAGRTSLKELAYLYSKCRVLISTDTGPMHMAAAMGCPVVAIFGPTAPWRTGPYGKGHKIIRKEMDCSPCFKKECRDITCMRDITVERVFESVKQLLK